MLLKQLVAGVVAGCFVVAGGVAWADPPRFTLDRVTVQWYREREELMQYGLVMGSMTMLADVLYCPAPQFTLAELRAYLKTGAELTQRLDLAVWRYYTIRGCTVAPGTAPTARPSDVQS
jgi:hypothetical protein